MVLAGRAKNAYFFVIKNVKLIFSLAVTFAKDNDGSSLEKTNGRSVGMRDKDQERDREREK